MAAAGKEILQRHYSIRQLHIFIHDCPADGGLVHFDFLGHVLKGERLKMRKVIPNCILLDFNYGFYDSP